MIQREHYLRRLGELELERSALLEQIGLLNDRLAALDKEYTAIRSILSSSSSDGRWTSQSTPLPEIVYNTLKKAGRPLHYKEILDRLQSESFHISGTASIQNLIVRLNRDRRFIKTDRGIYGLTEWMKKENQSLLPVNLEDNKDMQFEILGLTISEKRELEKIKFILESTDIDIQITKNNIKALRDKLLGRELDYKLPDNIDPKVASISFEKKLIKLLEQKDQLNQRLKQLERKANSNEDSG
jgi:hypothetical protein